MDIHKGDYLTFASIRAAHTEGADLREFMKCEVEPGVWRRHWDLAEHESRSDISRDGYLGVLCYALLARDRDMAERIIKAGWKRRWTMGDRGAWDYVNILPIVPLVYMVARGAQVPTIPPLAFGKLKTGYRAHLLALTIYMEWVAGKRRWSHRWSMRQLVKHNPGNSWFEALKYLVHEESEAVTYNNPRTWGSCPEDVYRKLFLATRRLATDVLRRAHTD